MSDPNVLTVRLRDGAREHFKRGRPSKSQTKHLAALRRRQTFLEDRLRAHGLHSSSYDAAEARALGWACDVLAALVAPPEPAPAPAALTPGAAGL